MINKLPKWVEIGGFFLALCAGSINGIGLLGFRHQAVSHLTGTSTFLGLEISQGNGGEILHLLGVNHEQLTYRHAGRDYRLTDVAGKVVDEILA